MRYLCDCRKQYIKPPLFNAPMLFSVADYPIWHIFVTLAEIKYYIYWGHIFFTISGKIRFLQCKFNFYAKNIKLRKKNIQWATKVSQRFENFTFTTSLSSALQGTATNPISSESLGCLVLVAAASHLYSERTAHKLGSK